MKQTPIDSESPRIVKKHIIAYIMDIEDQRMYPIVNSGSVERNAIELPPIRNGANKCLITPGGGDVAHIEVFDDSTPDRIVRIVRG